MPAERRATVCKELEIEIARREAEVVRLKAVVGNPEAVRAADGTTPQQRRIANLPRYIERRSEERARLEARRDVEEAIVNDKSRGRDERSTAAGKLGAITSHIEWLDSQPADHDLCPEHLCPDGVHLVSSHGYTWSGSDLHWPCSAWPEWKARVDKVLATLVASALQQMDLAPVGPKVEDEPSVLLKIPSNTAAADVAEQIRIATEAHPGAIARVVEDGIEIVLLPGDPSSVLRP